MKRRPFVPSAGPWGGARGRRTQGLRTYQQPENVEVGTQGVGRRPDMRRPATAWLGRAKLVDINFYIYFISKAMV